MIDGSGKDIWDKAEIIGKFAVPLVVAFAAVFLNNQFSKRSEDSEVTMIAVSILSSEPSDESRKDPLRTWAAQQMVDRAGMSEEAANLLLVRRLPTNSATLPIPQCEIWSDKEVVNVGEEFRIQWSGWPVHSTTFTVNETEQDANDAASYTWPVDRIDPVIIRFNGENAAGTCAASVTVKTIVGGTPFE